MRKKEKEKEKLEKWMRANENIIRCFGLASKVSVNSYGTEGGFSGHSRPNLFLFLPLGGMLRKNERTSERAEKAGLRFFVCSYSVGPTWSVPSGLTWPTESRRSQMGTRWKRPAGLLATSVDFVEGDQMSTDNKILLQHHLSLSHSSSLSLALKN